MFNETPCGSSLTIRARRLWSLAAGFAAMTITAGLLTIVPVMRASAVPPPPAAPSISKPTVLVAPRMKRVTHIAAAIPARAVYQPRGL